MSIDRGTSLASQKMAAPPVQGLGASHSNTTNQATNKDQQHDDQQRVARRQNGIARFPSTDPSTGTRCSAVPACASGSGAHSPHARLSCVSGNGKIANRSTISVNPKPYTADRSTISVPSEWRRAAQGSGQHPPDEGALSSRGGNLSSPIPNLIFKVFGLL